MKRISLLFMAILLSIVAVFFSGCTNEKITVESDVFNVEPLQVPEHPDVDVFFDASLSMSGYTTIAAGNLYRELPDELMDIGSSMGNINFYSFGNSIKQLKGSEYRAFINPAAYTELENSIKNVIDSTTPEHLTIVVTDLFETDAAWSVISSKIQDKYFKNKCSVAVVGLKSPFYGTIYDVGLDAAKFDYNSGSDPNKYRPVYMLVMGPNVHVNAFLKRCKEKNVGSGNLQIVKLSSALMAEKSADASSMPELDIKNAVERESLELPKDSNAVEYKIPSLDEEVEIIRSFKYIPDGYGCQLDFNKLKPQVKVNYYDKESGAWNSRAATGFNVTVVPNEEEVDVYDVHIVFNPKESLEPSSVNGVMVMLVPEYDGLVLPDWISQWNLPSGVAAGSGLDGSKTINLLRTVGSLKDSVLSTGTPSLINLVMYFDIR